jgi:hypothetical protein
LIPEGAKMPRTIHSFVDRRARALPMMTIKKISGSFMQLSVRSLRMPARFFEDGQWPMATQYEYDDDDDFFFLFVALEAQLSAGACTGTVCNNCSMWMEV